LRPSAISLSAIVVLAVVHTALGLLLLFALIRRRGASFFSQINFLVPLFGVMWGALILGERPSANAYAALALILAGLAVARRQPSIRGVAPKSPERKG
jgi:drug/metabolite transporter (DMT)-like permease